MNRTFVMTKEFDICWKKLRLGDDDLKFLQEELLACPTIGDRIPGTGGVRKYRFALEGRGKSGGARICYFDISEACKLYLLIAYAKNDQTDITMQQRNALKKVTQELTRLNLPRGKK